MLDITINAVDGGAHVSFPRSLEGSFRTAFPRARWVESASAWTLPGVTAERRAAKWAAERQAEATAQDKAAEDARVAAAFEGRELPPEGRDYFRALKAEGRKMSTPHVSIKFGTQDDAEVILVTCAFNEAIPPAFRKLGAAWSAKLRVWVVPMAKARALHAVVDEAEAVLAPIAETKAASKAAQQAEWDRQRAAESEARDAARRAAEAGAQWWIVGTEPPLGRPFRHRGEVMVATAYGERRRIDTDAIGVNGSSYDLDIHPCVRVSLRAATQADLDAAEAAERAEADRKRMEEEARAEAEEIRRAEVDRLADAIEAGEVLTVTSVSGRVVTLRPRRQVVGLRNSDVRATVAGVDGDMPIDEPKQIPEGHAREMPAYASLVAAGATHYAGLGHRGMLALTAAAAERVNLIRDAAEIWATRHEQAEDVARAAEIRATMEVHRVLVISDSHGNKVEEAWLPRSGCHEGYADVVRLRVPGPRGPTISWRCPSLHAVMARSLHWGMFPGYTNSLLLASDTDIDLLIAETAELERPKSPRPRPPGTPLTLPRLDEATVADQARREMAFDLSQEHP